MSRGPGRWQRALLAALDDSSLVSVRAVVMSELDREPTRAEMVAARRAARTLTESGRCRAIYLGECRRCYEWTSTWQCRHCGSGAAQALTLTSFDGAGSRLGSLQGLGALPPWVSVAPVPDRSEATLSGGAS